MRVGSRLTKIFPFLSKFHTVASYPGYKIIEDYPLLANILAVFAIIGLIILGYRGLKKISSRMSPVSAHNLSLVFLLIFCFLGATTQHALSSEGSEAIELEENWVATWGEEIYQSPRRIMIDDNHVYVVGRTWTSETEDSNIFLLKYDSDGGLVWNITLDSRTLDWSNEFAMTTDAIYVTGATLPNSTARDRDVLLLKVDKNGMPLWNRTWGGIKHDNEPSFEEGNDVEVLDEYAYVIGTTTNDSVLQPGHDVVIGDQDVLLLKYNSEGELICEKQYGGEKMSFEYGYCMEIVKDELYAVSKILTFDEAAGRLERLRLLKLDTDGNVLLNRTYDEISCDNILTPRGMLIEAGNIYVSGGISRRDVGWRLFMSKFDLTGEFQWVHVLEKEDYYTRGGTAVIEDHILSMAGDNTDRKNTEVILLDYDLEGSPLGNFTWGTDKNETSWDMRIVDDTMYLMGQMSSKGKTEVYLASIKNPYAFREEPEPAGFRGIPGFHHESIVIGMIIGVILIWQLSKRHARAQLTRKPLINLHARQ